jgi:hypothetical protein
MSVRILNFTREDLHEKVWEKALLQVASDYGISGNRLKKVCSTI